LFDERDLWQCEHDPKIVAKASLVRQESYQHIAGHLLKKSQKGRPGLFWVLL